MSGFYGRPRASVTACDQQQASSDIGMTNSEREVLPAYHGTPNRMHPYQTPPYGRSYLEPYNGNTMSTSTLYAQPMDPVIAQKLDTLLTNLEEQKKMLLQSEKESKEVRKEVLEMKAELNDLKKSVEENPIKHSGKSKQRVPKDVSHIVKTLHENASEEQKFDGSQGYSSEHNNNVRKFLLDKLKEKFKDTHSLDKLNRGVYRYYESRRRLVNDSKPGRIEIAKQTKHKSRNKMLRKQLYERRTKYTCRLKKKHQDLWKQITAEYMTEESDSDGEEIKQHKLQWRSEKLNSLIQKLDKLQEGGLKKGGFKQKPRVQSTPSLSFPPENAPKWAITQRDDVTREETAGTSMSFSPVSVPETSSISVTHTSTAFTEPHISEPPFTGSHSSDFHAHADIIDHLSSFSDSDSDD